MSREMQNQYVPDYVSPPGETLLELIEGLGMSQAELAQRMGRPKKTVNEIIRGKAAITPETALQLERVLGASAEFWNNRERNYRQYLARSRDNQNLAEQVGWIQDFPLKAMIELGWIQAYDDEIEQLYEMLRFFGIASPKQWDDIWQKLPVAFRRSTAFQSDAKALSAWLRQGEIEAQQINCRPHNAEAFRQRLSGEIRALTLQPPEIFQSELVRVCSLAGVAVVFVPQLPKARVSGATRWLNRDKALIQLSLRYRTDDHLWFTFFHEAGHILLHGKRDVFLEEDGKKNEKEREANEFARKILIPSKDLKHFLKQKKPSPRSKDGIRQFAAKLGIAPGIVVGRLQHDEVIPYKNCNELKVTFTWANKND